MPEIVGVRFGCLTVLSRIGTATGSIKSPTWRCICDCGGEKIVSSHNLKRGHTKSCGCLAQETVVRLKYKHGKSSPRRSREYNTWAKMIQRCINPKSDSWKDYGGRGITVCKRWKTFSSFYEDMGARPEDKTLDRIDVNGNYELSNCRWADHITQARNKRVLPAPTHCRKGHRLIDQNILLSRGKKTCRICRAISLVKYHSKEIDIIKKCIDSEMPTDYAAA